MFTFLLRPTGATHHALFAGLGSREDSRFVPWRRCLAPRFLRSLAATQDWPRTSGNPDLTCLGGPAILIAETL
jgi:hypothetical protein